LIVNGIRALLAGTLVSGFYRRKKIEVVRSEVPIHGLPGPFEGFSIAQISDIHSSYWVSEAYIRRCVDIINGLRSHALVLTGDFITGSMPFFIGKIGRFDSEYLDRCVRALSGLEQSMRLAVLGNHDTWSGEALASRITRALEASGIRVLRNRNIAIRAGGEEVRLIGVDDYWSQSFDLDKAMHGLPEKGTRILLSHNPDINDEWTGGTRDRVDLILSGHTHGGQINLPWIGNPMLPSRFGQKYRAGAVLDSGRLTYVNRGVGTLLIPLRFNCPPEITLHVLFRA